MSVRAVGVSAVAAIALLAGFFAFFGAEPASAPVPDKFDDRLVADVPAPTALAFTPDGRLLVTSKSGQVWVVNEGGQRTEAFDLRDPDGNGEDNDGRICDNEARGLLGIAVDPQFGMAGHNFVYLFHNFKKFGNCSLNQNDSPVNRVSRFVMEGDEIVNTSQDVLIDNIPNPNGQHDGGDVKFGKDGKLYVSVGDGSCNYAVPSRCGSQNGAARDKNILLGKILRVNPDGSIPADNPFMGSSSDPCGADGRVNENGRTKPGRVCQETFASGFRNPFRMAFDPNTSGTDTKFYVNDVGQGAKEEVNPARSKGDYGWNCVEGTQPNPARGSNCDPLPNGLVKPVHEYSHAGGCQSVTGGAFVPYGAGWPAAYDGAYLFGDYVCGKIFSLTPKSGGGFGKQVFAGGLAPGGPIAMAFGPQATGGSLYYTTFAGEGGQVRRISHTAGNRAPDAVAETAGNNYGDADPNMEGLQINFDASKSTDPDGDTPLNYEWDFGVEGTEMDTSTGQNPSYTYESSARYTVTLTVSDARGGESTDTIEVFPGNTPPEPTIETPGAEQTFTVGERITPKGSATDAEDGVESKPELQWEVLRHHDGDHTHPYALEEDGSILGPPPEDLASTDPQRSYLEVRLTATDSQGLSKTVVRDFRPKTTEVSFGTEPAGLAVKINGETRRAPSTLLSWDGYDLNVSAPRQQKDGRTYAFQSWSDGGAAEHAIETPDGDTGYTATFRRLRR